MDSRPWPCPPCGEITEFVQPPCIDGHTDGGGECPEWTCVECGAAVVSGELSVVADPVRARIAA
jgi:hypothetical protein